MSAPHNIKKSSSLLIKEALFKMGVPSEDLCLLNCDCHYCHTILRGRTDMEMDGYVLLYPRKTGCFQTEQWIRELPQVKTKMERDTIQQHGMLAAPLPETDVLLFVPTEVVLRERIVLVPIVMIHTIMNPEKMLVPKDPHLVQAGIYESVPEDCILLVEDQNVYEAVHGTVPGRGVYFRKQGWRGEYGYMGLHLDKKEKPSLVLDTPRKVAYSKKRRRGAVQPLIRRSLDGWFGEWIMLEAYLKWLTTLQSTDLAVVRMHNAFLVDDKDLPTTDCIKVEPVGDGGAIVTAHPRSIDIIRNTFHPPPNRRDLTCFPTHN